MDKHVAVKIVDALCSQDRALLLDALAHTKDTQPSILGEEWRFEPGGDYGLLVSPDGKDVYKHHWHREFSATPDMARALKEASRCQYGHQDGYLLPANVMSKIVAALEKAGIE